ncbi:iron-containing alcohol dehydrogenase [Baileyella intestinalis]|uniref:iron-containing alcohol dehydrogenase n=1 Tax=Baileyella intestinalis TaxID=2606709 RepID=UPI003A89978C
MNNFEFINPARIIFGNKPYGRIESLLKEMNVHSLMMIHTNSAVRLGIYDEIKEICSRLEIGFCSQDGIRSNPEIQLVRNIIDTARANNVDFLLAVGGGSVIDTAKAAAMGISYDGDVWDFFTGKAVPEKVLPIGAVSTIPASGSESSTATILSNGIHKIGYEDEKLIPKFAVLDPEFTVSLPPYLTATGISDILSHLMERFFTNTEHVDTTDYLIIGAAKSLLINGERVMKDPSDYDSRAEIQWLATIAHNNSLDTGRETDWASHRVEHELSAQYGINHGEGMAVVMLAYLRYVAQHHSEKTAQLAEQLFGIERGDKTSGEMTLEMAGVLEKYYKMLGLKTTLAEMGIDDKDFEDMADRATSNGTSTVGHYYPLDKEKFIDVLRLAL